MTKKEKLIITAYTGILMTKFDDFHKYAEKILEKPIFTHEFAEHALWEELKEKVKDDFLNLCK